MLLADEHLMLLTIPAASPVFIRPTDTERKIGLAELENILERTSEQHLTVEPIVVVTEGEDPVLARELSLVRTRIGHAQIIKPEVSR